MKTRPFGHTAGQITELTFGAMRLDDGPVSSSLLHALDKGIASIDTARAYGESELIIGRTLVEWGGTPPFISTKVLPEPGDWRHYVPLEVAYTPESIRRSVDDSLRNLRVESLDLVYLHQWYYLWTHRPEWLDTFQQLKKDGKIKAFGISAQDHEHDALLQVVDSGVIDAIQLIINIFESRPFVSLVPLCQARNVGVMARCVLDEGALTGLTREQWHTTSWLNTEFYTAYQQRLDALRARFCDDDTSLVELAIRFVLSHPGVSTLTMSMQDLRYIDTNLAAVAKGPLPPAVFDSICRDVVWTKNFFEPAFEH